MENSETKRLWEILVPKYSNEGIEYTVEYHQKWDEKIRSIAGGITILKKAKGHWVDSEGKTFIEEMIPVRIFCNEPDIEQIIDYTLEYYHQEAVFAYEISSNVKIKNKKE